VLAVLPSLLAVTAFAAAPVHIVKTDLKAGIRAGLDSPVQFAVLVPHALSATTGGTWSERHGTATWRYAMQVPTAVSLSFHAVGSALPDGATLVVQGTKTMTSYRARDLHRGELWSRIHPGDALQLTLTVAAADRDRVALNIVTLQAGYRALGPGVRDHPYYRQLRAQRAGVSGNASCVSNYECQVTAANTPPAAATLALIIGNLYQCSGALINDVPGDNTPYILTARHCENGQFGGGNPGAAATVTVYWDATSACGAALGSVYDAGVATQTGAQTVVEQQDAWLLRLDVNPVVADAQFAGFDASAGPVQGGYTVHHAEGGDKQFVAWFDTAAPLQQNGVLGTTYTSNFLETVNQLGNVGPGASGSALFDQNNHLVGSLSLGRKSNDPSGYEACPVANPPAPDGSNGAADFTSLAAIWNSTADATSSTGSTTLKSTLDPAGSGTLVVPSAPVSPIILDQAGGSAYVGQSLLLGWNGAGATSCTASGGNPGDGWSGALPASGTQSVAEIATGFVTYGLTCAYGGGRTARTALTVNWLGPLPTVSLSGPTTLWTTRPATLDWNSNVAPCSLSGGSLSLTNLAASGSTTTTQSTAGDVTYTLICGPSNNSNSDSWTVTYVTPSLIFEANGTDRRLGEDFRLGWITYADSCIPSGGAPNDGWATTAFNVTTPPQVFPSHVSNAGTYTYTLTCSSGPISLQQSVVVTFENNAPYARASINTPTVTFSKSPADYATISWNSNLSSCQLAPNPDIYVNQSDAIFAGQPQGSIVLAPQQSGVYQETLTCSPLVGSAGVTAQATFTVLPPPRPTETITFTPGAVVAGQSFIIAWWATNAGLCSQTGGIPNGAWGQPQAGTNVLPSGSTTETAVAGSYTFGLTCQSIDPASAAGSVQATLNISALSATLSSSAAAVSVGNSFTLTWSSVGASGCTASGGGASGSGWSGGVGTSGSATQAAKVSGTFTYSLVCSVRNVSTTPQQVTVTVSGAADSSGGISGGGGGALGLLELALLAVLGARRRLTSAGRTAACQGTA
jgi:hypothetical protein